MKTLTKTKAAIAGSAVIGLVLFGAVAAAGAQPSARSPQPLYTVRVVLAGADLDHSYIPAGSTAVRTEHLADPDDITRLGNKIFVGFQNGVGPQGQASGDGNPDSTVVELTTGGRLIDQWDVLGKADGVTADPETGEVIVTVNEDANSSLYTIDPAARPTRQVQHYQYNEVLPHNGGTDAISIDHGEILVSASAPGSTGPAAPQPTYPAVYSVTLRARTSVATVKPLFYDEDEATVANLGSSEFGQSVALALTDPDSNEVVPRGSRFGGDFMVTSQGDEEQIYVGHPGGRAQTLSVLSLTQSVDDTAWPTRHSGRLYSTDSTNDTVDVVTARFRPDVPLVVATPCGANSAPATCPAPPTYPANFLGSLDPATGQVTPVKTVGAPYTPQGGLVFIPGGHG